MELSCRRRQYHHGTTAALRGKPTATPSSKRTPTAHAAAELARGPQGSTPSWWQPGVGGLVTGAIRSLAVVSGPTEVTAEERPISRPTRSDQAQHLRHRCRRGHAEWTGAWFRRERAHDARPWDAESMLRAFLPMQVAALSRWRTCPRATGRRQPPRPG